MSNKTSDGSNETVRINGEPSKNRPYVRHILTLDERVRAIKAYERVPMYTKVAKMFNCSWEQIKNIIANRDTIMREQDRKLTKIRFLDVRHRLTLDERICVIKAYERVPMYTKVAKMFNCSWEQIKSIIANRDAIMSSSDSLKTWQNSDLCENDRKRSKIKFLDECVYEFIHRVQFHKKIDLTENLIRATAMEFCKIIQIDEFVPNRARINRYNATYNFSLSNPQIGETRTPPQTLDLKDILGYCSRKHRENRNHAMNTNSAKFTPEKLHPPKFKKNHNQVREEIIYLDAEDENDEYKYITPNEIMEEDCLTPTMKIHKVESFYDDDFTETASNSRDHWSEQSYKEEQPLLPQEVHNYDEALKLLAPLEEFAMLENNYRAIGIISQLEEIFKNSHKKSKK